jgi:lysophospholipase L1-like esterase
MKKMLTIPLLLAWFFGASFMSAGCMKNDNTSSSLNDSAKSYLALGDSYTIGQSVSQQERFPAQTVGLLRLQNVNIKDLQYIATTGWTTANLLNAIAAQNPQGPFDAVTLLIGVNDQYQGVDTATYRQRFIQALTKAIELSGNRKSHVFVLSIPDYSVTPFVSAPDKPRVRQAVDWFNAINLQAAQQMNITYVDITPSSREGATNAALIAGDGLHPSGLEYKKWAGMLAPLIKQALQ